jgi:hypothetical protein
MVNAHVNNYEIIRKVRIEEPDKSYSYMLRLLYRGDGTHHLATNAGLEWSVNPDFFNAVAVGDYLSITTKVK